jgi:hypothetical protein
VIAAPPFAGAFQARLTDAFPPVATVRTGAPGTVAAAAGVAESSFERLPSPTEFSAVAL